MTRPVQNLVLPAAVLCLLLGACGQSGPLYLPGNPSRVQVENPDETTDDGAGTDEETNTGD